MSPKYVLSYFAIAGRAEAARLLFVLADVEFTDKHISNQEWAQIKADSKFN